MQLFHKTKNTKKIPSNIEIIHHHIDYVIFTTQL